MATLLLTTAFIQTACVSLTPSHVPQYQTFHTALPYLMFNLQLTNSSQQCKTTRNCRTPMKCSIVILILRSKQYHRVTVMISLDSTRLYVCILARFKENCEVKPLGT